jgi:hypothetical protein
VRLKDYKVELGQYSFEKMDALQLYNADTYEWVDIQWNFPLLVYVIGKLIAVKCKAVTQVMGLNDLVTACQVLNYNLAFLIAILFFCDYCVLGHFALDL